MRRRSFLSTLAGAGLAPLVGRIARGVPTTPSPLPHAGVCFDAYQATAARSDFEAVAGLGATHVALHRYARMETPHTPGLEPWAGPDDDASLTTGGLLRQGRLAADAGLQVVICPTVSDPVAGRWRGEVRMPDEAAWRSWFAAYERFVLDAADLARTVRAAGMSVGTELRGTVHRADDWSRLIGRVRERFGGWLTYAANWNDYEAVPWWEALDLAGVQAYFPLGSAPAGGHEARTAALEAAWRPVTGRLAAFHAASGRRVLFTEIGYKSAGGATEEPWLWRPRRPADPGLQAAAYEAVFRACWREPWFAGAYWWKWHPATAAVPDAARNFTPQGKAAEEVLRRWWRGTGASRG